MRALLDEFKNLTLSVTEIETKLEAQLLKFNVRADNMAHILSKLDVASELLTCALVTTRGVLGMDDVEKRLPLDVADVTDEMIRQQGKTRELYERDDEKGD